MIPKERTANHNRQFKTSFGSFPRLSLKIFCGFPPPPAMMTDCVLALAGEEKEKGGRGERWHRSDRMR